MTDSVSLEEALIRVQEDEDFIALRRYNYSLKAFLEKHPDGASDKLIAQALLIDESEVQEIYEAVVAKLQTAFGKPTLS